MTALRALKRFLNGFLCLSLLVLLAFPAVLVSPPNTAEAAGTVLLNGWGCYSGCSWTDPNTGRVYTVTDTNYSPAGPVVSSRKSWSSVVDWYGTPSYIYPTNVIDSESSCITAGGYAGKQLHGTSSWVNPDGQVQEQETWGACTTTNSPPVVSISCPPSGDVGSLIYCGASSSDSVPQNDYIASKSWTGNGQNFGPFSSAGYQTLCVSATDSLGASSQACANVYISSVNRNPNVSVNCPATVQADASGKGTFSCSASGSDPDGDAVTVSMGGNTGTGSVSASFTYSPGTYTISASASDGKGGSASATTSVTVTGAAGSPSATVACSPSSIPADGKTTTTCTASATGGTPPYSFSWGSSSKTFGPHTSAGAQSVSVTVTDSLGKSGGGSGTYSVTAGSISVSVSCSPNNITSTPGSSTCTASAGGGNGSYSYAWSNGGTASSTTYTGVSSATTASVTVRDTAGATGSGSATITVNGSTTTCPPGYTTLPGGGCQLPCYPDPDYRSMSVTFDPTLVRAGMGFTTGVMSTSGSTSQRRATASWGETKDFEYKNGRWEVTFLPPYGLSGDYTITASATISQGDGCGGTYGPSTFTDRKTITIYQVKAQPPEDGERTSFEDMTVTNMPLEQYLDVCLGALEPWYCGIDAKLASIYTPTLLQREEWYRSSLGALKWAILVKRIDNALNQSGYSVSGLTQDW